MATKKKIQSSVAGVQTDAVPESPIFRSTERAERDYPNLHVGGEPIPEHLREFIPFANTDEGIAERLSKTHATAEVIHSERPRPVHEGGDFSKTLDARVNARMDTELFEAPDPLREAIEAHVPQGFRGKFLSDRVVDRLGLRGWQAHLVKGEPVKVGGMKLAVMPEQKARARTKFYQERGAQRLALTQEQHDEELERLHRAAGVRPPARRAGRPDPAGGLQETRGNMTILR